MDTYPATTIDPKILGFWTRCLRQTSHMSQDALAVASGLDVRTIQRIENGKSVNVTTRRCLARGLRYENHDTFDTPDFIANVTGLLKGISEKQLEQENPDCIRVQAAAVTSGSALAHFAETANAVMLHADEALSSEANQTAASLFDFLRDMIDLGETSYSDRLSFVESLDALRQQLAEQGASLYSAFRPVKVSSDSWPDRTPLSFVVGYMTAVPNGTEIKEMMVPKSCQFA